MICNPHQHTPDSIGKCLECGFQVVKPTTVVDPKAKMAPTVPYVIQQEYYRYLSALATKGRTAAVRMQLDEMDMDEIAWFIHYITSEAPWLSACCHAQVVEVRVRELAKTLPGYNSMREYTVCGKCGEAPEITKEAVEQMERVIKHMSKDSK